MFKNASELKRSYEFFANPKTCFQRIVKSSHYRTANRVNNLPLILSVGETTFLDYKQTSHGLILQRHPLPLCLALFTLATDIFIFYKVSLYNR